MQQTDSNEFVLGPANGLGIGESDFSLYFGGWYRVKDAFFPYIGLRSMNYQLGLSYDITSSDLSKAKGFSGSSELSLLYFFNNETKKGLACFF